MAQMSKCALKVMSFLKRFPPFRIEFENN